MRYFDRWDEKMQVVRLGIAVGLVMLFLTVLLQATAVDAYTEILSSGPKTGTTSSLNNGSVITIGVGADLTVRPELGWSQVNAVQLAVDEVNAAGGITVAGEVYTLTLVVADDECSAAQAITATNSLLDAGVVAVIGHSCTGATMAAQPLYAAAGVPTVGSSSTAPSITEQGYTTTFRVITRDDYPPTLLATYLRDWQKLEKAAIIELDGFWGNWATDPISDTFALLGGTITSRRSVNSTAEYTAALTAVQAESPDVIFYTDTDAGNAGLLSSVAQGLGMTDTIIAWNTLSEDEAALADYEAQAGAAAVGDMALMFYRRTQDMPGYEALNVAYQAAGFPNYGDEATTAVAFTYDAANIVFASIRSAQSTNPNDIRDAIASTSDYQGVVGIYEGFDAKGDVVPQWAWLEQYANGQWEILRFDELFLPAVLTE